MNLIIDIGNTFSKISIFSSGEELYFERKQDLDVLFLESLNEKFPEIKNVILSSVKKTNFDDLLNNIFDNFIILDEKTPMPIKIDYETPDTLGKDRVAAAVGANVKYPKENVLIIDAGTAITYDFISNEGVYLGGNISPGLNTRFKALHQFTGKLPLLTMNSAKPSLTGKFTNQAITGGVHFGMIYEIQGYIEEYKKKYGNIKILMTGGDANYFVEKLKNSIFVIFNLNMIGLNRILEYNVTEE